MGDESNILPPLFSQYSVFLTVLGLETIILTPAIIFTTINVIVFDHESYNSYHPGFSEIVAYNFLIPLLVIQSLWILSNFLSLLAIILKKPYFFLPSLATTITGFIISLIIVGPGVDHLIRADNNEWKLIAFIIGLSIFIMILITSITIRVVTFKKLIKRKKTVQGTTEKATPVETEGHPTDPELGEDSITFSRRSTVSISDERTVIPPRL